MSTERVRKYFKEKNIDFQIFEMQESTATVELAAKAHNVEPSLIAKTMAITLPEKNILIVTDGTSKIDNKKFKEIFKAKCQMVKFDDVQSITGHPVGGVCPFALNGEMEVYMDEGLKKYEFVYPAAGSTNSSVKISPSSLASIVSGIWIDVCKRD